MTSPIPTAATRSLAGSSSAAASPGSAPGSASLGAGPGEVGFSPSKMTPGTLGRFSDSETSGVPLQSTWTFWMDKANKNSTAAQYQANLKRIYAVSTVQGFWSVYHHIPSVTDLPLRCYYHLMRDDRQPLWEDPALAKGGVWRLKCPERETPVVWRELLLALIGEQFLDDVGEEDEICGLSVSPRERDDLFQIWNIKAATVNPDEKQDKVLRKVHKLLPEVKFMAEFYKPHETHSAFEGNKMPFQSRGPRRY